MVGVAQLVRALDCGSRGRGFKSHLSPKKGENRKIFAFFLILIPWPGLIKGHLEKLWINIRIVFT